jgi:hypothetical protein
MEKLAAGHGLKEIGHVTPVRGTFDFEHFVNSEVVVKGEDGNRQVFMKRLEEYGEIGGESGFADPPFFGGNGNYVGIWFHAGYDNIYPLPGQRLV